MSEYNVIQNPEALRRIREWVGSRQPHIGSTLDENVQMVVLVDDLREARREVNVKRRLCAGGVLRPSDAVNHTRLTVGNPANSGVLMKLRRVVVGNSAIGPVPFALNHNRPLSGFVSTLAGPRIFMDLGLTDAGYFNNTAGVIVSQQVAAAIGPMAFAPQNGIPLALELGDMTLFEDQYFTIGFTDAAAGGTVSALFFWTEEPKTV